MRVVAVALQVCAAVAATVAAGLFFDTVWAAVLVAALFVFLVGNALESR